MDILSIIENKRDKKELTKNEIDYFIKEYTNNNIPDYQASALIMAMYLNGLSKEETFNLTNAMASSGEILDLTDISSTIVDKHSTGGVGDKITIILMPIIASLGIPVAKMSGRGLGFTGGTADKLEAIPNYRVDIDIDEFKQNVKDIGISLITTNLNLAPADKKIYALRDTIGCVSSIPLIASSIMSKKNASGANKIVMDITCGSGAFMKDIDNATELAKLMIEIGKNSGKEVRCVITNMNEPVGYAIGNQLEIIEAIESLRGNMPGDVKEIVYSLGTQILLITGKAENEENAQKQIEEAIRSGNALRKFEELVTRQGGDTSYIEDTSKFQNDRYVIPVEAISSGYVKEINTEEIGKISSFIGAGREQKEDVIDLKAGIVITKKIGDIVNNNEIIAYIHTDKEEKIEEATRRIQEAFVLISEKTEKENTIIKTII